MDTRSLAACSLVVLSLLAGLPAGARAQAAVLAPPQAAAFVEIPATADTLHQLRQGGFVLYMRHGHTDNTRPDRATGVDLNDCATQRPLTPEGRRVGAQVGQAVRLARIPIGEIHVSPLCRVRDTVDAAFPGRTYAVDDRLIYTANFTDAEKAPILARTRSLLSAPVAAGINRLVIAHAPNLMDLIGYFPKEATLVVFRPRGADGGFDYVASFPPDLWATLLRKTPK